MKKFSNPLVFAATMILLCCSAFLGAQNIAPTSWKAKYERPKLFIENKGQFQYKDGKNDLPVLYAMDHGSTMGYFTAKGLTYSFLKAWQKGEIADMMEEEINERVTNEEEYKEREQEEHRLEYQVDQVSFEWENSNPDVKIIAEQMAENYFSYTFKKDGKLKGENMVHGFKKITYKNLYPNIDVEYVFHPEEGLKYSIILHPGADPSQIKMKYKSSEKLSLNENNLNIRTKFGNIVDHAPLTFYEGNPGAVIKSNFLKSGNTISFHVDAYDNTRTVVIDPWTVTPAFATNWDCVWECERDGAGNVYIIGGVMPMQLIKYNPAGAIQWTYNTPYDTTSWLGTFATDNVGNSYVTLGSTAEILKVNTAGALQWSNTSPGGIFGTTEFWTIAFNCDQTLLVIGGTGGGIPPKPYIYNVNTTTGNIASSVQVHGGGGFTGQEIRAITPCGNGKYFYMSHDSIGYIDQNFSFCPTGSGGAYHRNNQYTFGYKCENWRKNNTGICAIRANTNFVYTHKGNGVDKRSLTTANIITSAAVAGGAFTAGGFGSGNFVENSGLDIDQCGNVYAGSKLSVVKYDANLSVLATYPVSFNVYDVHVNTGGDIIACGSLGDYNSGSRAGYIQSIVGAACAPLALTCCNPSICAPTSMCVSAAPVTLQAATSGGTWSGPGVNAAGVFNPATAGAGTWTITYTLACGNSTTTITVNPCTALSVCQSAGPTLTVSGGSGPYTWQNQVTTTPCVAGLGFCAGPFTAVGPPVTSWSTFGTGTSVTYSGTYPIQVVDNAGTVFSIPSLASLPPCTACPTLTVTPASQVNVACFGGSTGSFSASTTGGASPYDYVLMNGATTVATFNNIAGSQAFGSLPAGTYTLNVVDNNNCPGSTTITITQPASAVAVSITGTTNASCGASTGSATAQASGGSSPWDYVWTGASGTLQTTNNITTSNTLSGLAAGTYTVTITDNNGCTATTTATITNSSGGTVSISGQTNVLCFGGTTGNATATAAGGTGPYDYVWTGASGTLQTTNNISVPNTLNTLGAGTYTVTVTDNNGCTATTTATITQPASAAAVAITGTTNAPCGASTGSATALASGGTSPYDYVWTGASGTLQTTTNVTTSDVLNGLGAGTYTVTMTDANGCTATTTATITSTSGGSVSITAQTNVLCFGGTTGDATATASGGTAPYDYVWTGASGTLQTTNNISVPNTLSGLGAGTYTVSVTDNSGCVSTSTVTITQPATAAAVAITGSTNTACGSSTGTATALASGGSGPYDYVWTGASGTLQTTNNSATSDVLSGLAGGTYTITVTDNNGCTATTNVSITSSGGATVSITGQTNVLCFGGTTGDATATAVGGTTPYDYVWTNASGTLQTTNNITGSNTLSGLAAGTYTITVTDSMGCVSTANATITQPATAAAVATTGTTPAGCGMSNGTATALASGGTGPYDYVWTGGTGTLQTTNNSSVADNLSGLAAGTYTVTITDNNGCTATTTATVTNSGGATTSITTQTNVSCFGGTNGSATANTTGGTSPYDYVWTGSTGVLQTTNNITVPNTINGLGAGTYTITVTDNGGCISSATVTITQPATALTSSTFATVNTTCGLSNGGGTISASGGTIGTGYTYVWAPSGGTGTTATGLASGTYTVTTTDGNGCTSTTTVAVGASTGVTASISSQTNVLCNGGLTGTATAAGSGGTTYTYAWSPAGGTAATASGLAAGTYTVTVTSGSCSNTNTVTITQPAVLTASVNTTAATCSGANGTATVTAGGGTGTITNLWSTSATTSTITGLTTGTYSVIVTDVNGCTQTASGVVGNSGSITASAGPNVVITSGSSTTLNASGGTSYTWTPATGLSCTNCASPVATPTVTTTYCVLADSAGCMDSSCVTVTVKVPCPENKDLAVPNAFSPNGDGYNDILCLEGWTNCIQTFTIFIFDRWGEKVFESKDAGFCWDGKYKGKTMDPAVFVYFIDATFTNDTKVEAKGNISLIR